MPRYFFHVEDHKRFLDDEGTILADLVAARVEAVRVFGEVLRDHADEFWASGEWRVVVTDDQQTILFALSFESVHLSRLPRRYDLTDRPGRFPKAVGGDC